MAANVSAAGVKRGYDAEQKIADLVLLILLRCVT